MLLIRALFLQFFQRAVRTLNAHAVQHGLHVGLEAVQILLTQRRLLLDLALRQSDGSFFAGQLVNTLDLLMIHGSSPPA